MLTGGTGTITGTVTDADGQPLGGVEVTVTRGDFTADTATLTTPGPAPASAATPSPTCRRRATTP